MSSANRGMSTTDRNWSGRLFATMLALLLLAANLGAPDRLLAAEVKGLSGHDSQPAAHEFGLAPHQEGSRWSLRIQPATDTSDTEPALLPAALAAAAPVLALASTLLPLCPAIRAGQLCHAPRAPPLFS